MKRRNDWTCKTAQQHPSLVAFIGLDPSMGPEDAVAEVHRCREQGAVGHQAAPVEPALQPGRPEPVAGLRGGGVAGDAGAVARGLVPGRPGVVGLLAAAGVRARAGGVPATALRAGAHGQRLHRRGDGDGGAVPEHARRQLVASFRGRCSRYCRTTKCVALLRRFGAERVLFASDWPWFHPLRDLERIETLALSSEERRLILSENARRVMGI